MADQFLVASGGEEILRRIAALCQQEKIDVDIVDDLGQVDDRFDELKKLNVTLEQRIVRRTLQLSCRSELLNAILEGETVSEIIEKAVSSIKNVCDAETVEIVSISVDIKSVTGSFSNEIAIHKLRKTSLASRVPLLHGNLFAIPIRKLERDLGTLYIEGGRYTTLEDMTPVLEGFIAAIFLALSQHKSIQNAPAIMSNVDKLLESIEAE